MKKSFSVPLRICINILITLAAAAIYFYIVLPPINVQSSEFWTFAFLILIVFSVLTLLTCKNKPQESGTPHSLFSFLWKNIRIPVILMVYAWPFVWSAVFFLLSSSILRPTVPWSIYRKAIFQKTSQKYPMIKFPCWMKPQPTPLQQESWENWAIWSVSLK